MNDHKSAMEPDSSESAGVPQQEMSAVLEGARAVLTHQSFEQAAHAIFNTCRTLIGASSGYVALLSTDGTESDTVFLKVDGMPYSTTPELPMPIRGLREQAYRTGRPAYDNDFVNSEWAGAMPADHIRLDNVLLAPLNLKGRTIGLMSMANKPGGFTDHDASLASAFGQFAAIALHNERMIEATQRNERRYRGLFDSMSEGFALHEMLYDDDGKPCDYRFLDVNPAFEELTGLPASAVLGKTVLEAMPSTEPMWIETYGRVVASGQNMQFESYSRELDRYYSVSAFVPTPGLFGAIFLDITPLKRSERELREQTKLARTLLDSLPCVALLTEPSTGKIVATNEPAARIGAGPGRPCFTGWTRRKERCPWCMMAQAMESNQPQQREIESEGIVWEIHWAPIGEDLCLHYGFDITDRRRLEQNRRKLDAQIQHSQKLESLGVLAGGIAHDFNNLLMGILGNADLALSDLPAVSPARPSVLEIEKASRRAADLCRQMLAYSGKGRFVVEPVDLSEVIHEMSHMLDVSISKNAVVRYEFGDSLPAFEADATQIHQVVMNLIINASDAIGDRSGIISVRTGAMDCDESYLNDTYLDEGLPAGLYVTLEVSDTGCGMSPETVSRLFDPFFTTKFTGRGLGLAAVLGIIRGHKGAIKVYSELGKGTTFKALFPACDLTAKTQRTSTGQTGQWRGTGTVLLADDEETVRAVGKKMLERLGFDVVTARDGREAVELFARHAERITCVLLDLTMPHLDGEGAYRGIRRIQSGVPVIVCSGYNEQEVAQRFIGKGLAGFIQKPYQLNVLTVAIRHALGDEPPDLVSAE